MARKPAASVNHEAFDEAGAVVHDISIEDEVSGSFLEYAYSVIHSRALPDARDGLKPVHRRILFSMSETGLRPDKSHVKSARVVGDVMGKYHPHGDSAIYETMVRLAQDFSLNTPLIDGKGNWGGVDDPAAASRYTECRMSPYALLMTDEIDEDTVDFRPNYDGSLDEPTVLPAAFPNLLVNGGTGIAVGMATNMIPHNLAEVVNAAKHLIKNPNARLDTLMGFVPGPDLPTGGLLIGMDAVRQAYETGRGVVRLRGRAEVGPIEGSRGRQGITFTELPYGVGAEKVIEAIKKEIGNKRLAGVADVKDLSDRQNPTRLVIECKTGVNPQALLADLYQYTPLETSFGINNVVLVDGQPRTLGLKELLTVFLDHRYEVVTRRTQYRKRKAEDRLHIVDGLLIALDNIDEVVKIIRSSKDTSIARDRLIRTFKLSDIQAGHILDMPLRRLVALEVESLRNEKKELIATIAGLQEILDNEDVLKKVVSDELTAVVKQYGYDRRTTLIDGDLKEVLEASKPAGPLEVKDEPCHVLLSASGLLARTAVESEEAEKGRAKNGRARHDQIAALIPATSRGQFLIVTSNGRAFKTDVLTLPVLPEADGNVNVRGGMSVTEVVSLQPGETVVGIAPMGASAEGSPGLAIGTRQGTVKVTSPEWPVRGEEFEVIGLKDDDTIVAAHWLTDGAEELVFVTNEAQLLHFPANKVRPQGLKGGGMAGINLGPDATVIAFNIVPTDEAADAKVVTFTGESVKVTPFTEYPGKGRATGGVRCHTMRKGEDGLAVAWVGAGPFAGNDKGEPIDLPEQMGRRDGSGTPATGISVVGYQVNRA